MSRLAAVFLAAFLSIFGINSAFASEEAGISAVLLSLETDGEAVSLTFDKKVNMQIVHLDGPPRIIKGRGCRS
jgi:hypothetical protein